MITLSMARMAKAPIMWIVMLWGNKLPSTTNFPSHATNPKAKTAPKASTVVFKSLAQADASKSNRAGTPAKAPSKRLMNSTQVCNG